MNYSIEFTGGTLMQLTFKQPPHVDDIRAPSMQAGYPNAEITQVRTDREYTVRAQPHVADAARRRGGDSTATHIESALAPAVRRTTFTRRADRVRRPARRRRAAAQRDIAVLISFVVTLIYLAFASSGASASPPSSPPRTTCSRRSRSSRCCASRSRSPSSRRSSP